jgi:hypothetical protein
MLAMSLQSIIARTVNDGKYGLVSSFDLSPVFDVMNIKLLLKKLRIKELPKGRPC